MTAQLIEAPEAQAIGLIDEVVEPEQLKPRVEALASTLAANAPLTIKATKQIIETMTAPMATVASGAPWYAEVFRSHDFKMGLDAFFNKRKPEFRGE
jgi:enoyl-CoA hydratase/carnithine racemase